MVWYAVYDTQKYSTTKQRLNSSSSSNKLQLNKFIHRLTHDDPAAAKMVPLLSSSAAGSNGAYR